VFECCSEGLGFLGIARSIGSRDSGFLNRRNGFRSFNPVGFLGLFPPASSRLQPGGIQRPHFDSGGLPLPAAVPATQNKLCVSGGSAMHRCFASFVQDLCSPAAELSRVWPAPVASLGASSRGAALSLSDNSGPAVAARARSADDFVDIGYVADARGLQDWHERPGRIRCRHVRPRHRSIKRCQTASAARPVASVARWRACRFL
jgi:hypothetical protein